MSSVYQERRAAQIASGQNLYSPSGSVADQLRYRAARRLAQAHATPEPAVQEQEQPIPPAAQPSIADEVSASASLEPTLIATGTDLASLKSEYPGYAYLNSGDVYGGKVLYGVYAIPKGAAFTRGEWVALQAANPGLNLPGVGVRQGGLPVISTAPYVRLPASTSKPTPSGPSESDLMAAPSSFGPYAISVKGGGTYKFSNSADLAAFEAAYLAGGSLELYTTGGSNPTLFLSPPRASTPSGSLPAIGRGGMPGTSWLNPGPIYTVTDPFTGVKSDFGTKAEADAYITSLSADYASFASQAGKNGSLSENLMAAPPGGASNPFVSGISVSKTYSVFNPYTKQTQRFTGPQGAYNAEVYAAQLKNPSFTDLAQKYHYNALPQLGGVGVFLTGVWESPLLASNVAEGLLGRANAARNPASRFALFEGAQVAGIATGAAALATGNVGPAIGLGGRHPALILSEAIGAAAGAYSLSKGFQAFEGATGISRIVPAVKAAGYGNLGKAFVTIARFGEGAGFGAATSPFTGQNPLSAAIEGGTAFAGTSVLAETLSPLYGTAKAAMLEKVAGYVPTEETWPGVLGKSGQPVPVYVTKAPVIPSEFAEFWGNIEGVKAVPAYRLGIVADVTMNPGKVSDLVNELVGNRAYFAHATLTPFPASGSTLLEANPGMAKGFRLANDLLGFYSAPTLVGEPTVYAYGGYIGIGEGYSDEVAKVVSGGRPSIVVASGTVEDFAPLSGESVPNYVKRINLLSGKTGIAPDNYLGASSERQTITPTAFEGLFGDYPGTKLFTTGKLANVIVQDVPAEFRDSNRLVRFFASEFKFVEVTRGAFGEVGAAPVAPAEDIWYRQEKSLASEASSLSSGRSLASVFSSPLVSSRLLSSRSVMSDVPSEVVSSLRSAPSGSSRVSLGSSFTKVSSSLSSESDLASLTSLSDSFSRASGSSVLSSLASESLDVSSASSYFSRITSLPPSPFPSYYRRKKKGAKRKRAKYAPSVFPHFIPVDLTAAFGEAAKVTGLDLGFGPRKRRKGLFDMGGF